jgi:carbon-monoxide dehydrogenase medium subunit
MVARGDRGERTIPADEFFDGHFTTTLADDELLTAVRVPKSPVGAGWSFLEVVRRHGDFAMVGVGAMVRLDGTGRIAEGRICLMGVADRAVRPAAAEAALVGAEPTTATFTEVAEEAVRGLEPASDLHGSSQYRRHLARVTVRRALAAAAAQTGGS